MRGASLILALVLQPVTVSLAQDTKVPVRRPIPQEHKDFVAEVENVYAKYPKAAARYKLVDVGLVDFARPRVSCDLECEWDASWGGWCKDRCESER